MVLFKCPGSMQTMHLSYNLHSTMVLFKFDCADYCDSFAAFTFHYGPIQIFDCADYCDSFAAFTFHYGPIQIHI